MKLTTYGSISQGKLVIFNRNEFLEIISAWKDCAVELTLKSKTKGRSLPQNRYYFSVIGIVRNVLYEQHGLFHSSEYVHDFLKSKFNSIEIMNQDGVIENFPKSTTTLSTAEFEEYLEKIRRWAHDFFGISIPLPNEQTELF